jgi:outer membrane lipoprotein-sorting protein
MVGCRALDKNGQNGMKRRPTIAAAAALLAALLGAVAGSPARAQSGKDWTVEAILKQLDRMAGDFHSLTADLEHTKVTVVVNDRSTETGQISVRRDEKMRIEITKPDPRTILRNGDSLYLYNPKIKRVEEYNLGKHKAMVDQYVLLGFGTKGEDLKKHYLVTPRGEETLDNRKVLLLELTPKSEEVRNQISKIELWIDESAWVPVQQKFYETGSGDYFIFHYSNIARNTKISESTFKPEWPKGVTKIKPRG